MEDIFSIIAFTGVSFIFYLNIVKPSQKLNMMEIFLRMRFIYG